MGNQVSKHSQIALFAGLILCLHIGCTGTSSQADETENKDVLSEPTCQIKSSLPEDLKTLGDSSYHFVQRQVDFGPRVPETEPHKLCGDYLIEVLNKYADTVVTQPVQDKLKAFPNFKIDSVVQGRNIWAQFNPEVTTNRILLAAHWDTRPHADSEYKNSPKSVPFDGADDGASGVGVLLDIARVLNHLGTDQGIDILFFDLEDYGSEANPYCVGSKHWSNDAVNRGIAEQYTSGILLDMVGAKDAYFTKEKHSTEHASHVLNSVWCLAKDLGYSELFEDFSTRGVIDDHLYVNTIAEIPMIDIIHWRATETFGEHWHTSQDNMSLIDADTLHAVRQVVLSYLYSFTEPPA